MAHLQARGGVAGGDAGKNPSQTSYANEPPKSTYPTVAGSYGGFVGVFVGTGIFILIVLACLMLLRVRSMRRQAAAREGASSASGYEQRPNDEWNVEEEAFEMPHYDGRYDASTVHLDSPGLGQEPPLYAHDGVSQDAFFDDKAQRTYRDPYEDGVDRERGTTATGRIAP
ncbi:hypothetical protein JCM10908_004454 [Rhodotorula pacifica]|uniref:uncharacterized protein n=1 Tax=Rhodotorula pacifica TaxID=1495444 RepID=UPI0031711150